MIWNRRYMNRLCWEKFWSKNSATLFNFCNSEFFFKGQQMHHRRRYIETFKIPPFQQCCENIWERRNNNLDQYKGFTGSEDFTNVTLVSEDACQILFYCNSGVWGRLLNGWKWKEVDECWERWSNLNKSRQNLARVVKMDETVGIGWKRIKMEVGSWWKMDQSHFVPKFIHLIAPLCQRKKERSWLKWWHVMF